MRAKKVFFLQHNKIKMKKESGKKKIFFWQHRVPTYFFYPGRVESLTRGCRYKNKVQNAKVQTWTIYIVYVCNFGVMVFSTFPVTFLPTTGHFQVFHSNAIHGLQCVGSGLVLVRGGKSRATVKVKMKKKREEKKEEEEEAKRMVMVEEEVVEEDWLLASYSIDSSLFLLTAHNKLLVRGEERREVKASSGPCILYR